MTDEIRPALSPEEWAELSADHGMVAINKGDGSLQVYEHGYGLDCSMSIWPEHRHAVAALALYGQPYGFTQDDMDALNELHDMALRAIQERGDLEDSTVPPRAAAAISKLVALLPPAK